MEDYGVAVHPIHYTRADPIAQIIVLDILAKSISLNGRVQPWCNDSLTEKGMNRCMPNRQNHLTIVLFWMEAFHWSDSESLLDRGKTIFEDFRQIALYLIHSDHSFFAIVAWQRNLGTLPLVNRHSRAWKSIHLVGVVSRCSWLCAEFSKWSADTPTHLCGASKLLTIMPPLLNDDLGLTTIDSPTTIVSRKYPTTPTSTSPMSRLRILSGESSQSLPPYLPSSPSSSSSQQCVSPPTSARLTDSFNLPLNDLSSSKENDPQENNRRRCASIPSALESLEKNASFHELMELRLRHSVGHYGETHPVTAKLFIKMGNLHFRKEDFTMAEMHYKKATLCASELHVAYLNLGTVYWRTKQLDKARKHLKLAKRGTNDTRAKASVYHQLGLCYALSKDYMNSLHALTKACNIRMRYNGESHTSVAKTLDAIGRVHLMQEEYDAAIHYHNKALSIVQANHQKTEIAGILSNLVAVFKAAGRFNEAREALNEMNRLSPSEQTP